MAGTKLLPCPFCWGEAEMLTAESMNGGYLFGIMCNDCRSRGDVYDTEAEAIEAWNTRADTATLYEDGFYLHGRKFVPERTCHNIDEEFPYFKCSECGCNAVVGYGSSGGGLPNYCPNCGAKVVSE